MSLLKRLESMIRPWAIPNLTGIIIAGQVVLYVAYALRRAGGAGGDAFSKLYLIPSLVLEGEVWRIFTFPLVPFSLSPIGALFGWILFYLFGSALENYWGTVRYNLFLGIGFLANVAAAFATLAIHDGYVAQNHFLYATTFLGFARLYPDYTIHLFFILPIRIKWLALLMWLGFALQFLEGSWMDRFLVVASLLNYFLFFGRDHWYQIKGSHRRRAFQAKAKDANRSLEHQCRVCGLDSESSPRTLFRYCSKCAGQCCYCPEHIHNHEHVTAEEATEEEQ